MRKLSHGLLGLYVDGFGLRFADRGEGVELAVIESRVLAKGRKADGRRIHAMELCKCDYGRMPPSVKSEYVRWE